MALKKIKKIAKSEHCGFFEKERGHWLWVLLLLVTSQGSFAFGNTCSDIFRSEPNRSQRFPIGKRVRLSEVRIELGELVGNGTFGIELYDGRWFFGEVLETKNQSQINLDGKTISVRDIQAVSRVTYRSSRDASVSPPSLLPIDLQNEIGFSSLKKREVENLRKKGARVIDFFELIEKREDYLHTPVLGIDSFPIEVVTALMKSRSFIDYSLSFCLDAKQYDYTQEFMSKIRALGRGIIFLVPRNLKTASAMGWGKEFTKREFDWLYGRESLEGVTFVFGAYSAFRVAHWGFRKKQLVALIEE